MPSPADDGFFALLSELALNLYATWNHSADELWARLDPELWELTHNPWVVLQTTSRTRVEAAKADTAFRDRLAELVEQQHVNAVAAGWFHTVFPASPLTSVAYFSLEYLLSEALPIYSGGLGNVAGDQLKAAHDLRVPVVGVGLLYQQGYFRQHIDKDGKQEALYPFNDPGQLPVMPVRQPGGEWLRIPIALPGIKLWIRTWQVQVGFVRLYLLDTNDPANPPEYRGITAELYGGGPEVRISQEQVLGMAGWRLLQALHIRPEVCHLNEGHAAFVVIERARSFMGETQQNFDAALAATRAGNIFTTHTPVEAGFDRFAPDLMERHFRRYAEVGLSISFRDFLALGRDNPDDDAEPFSMANLALRGSGAVNAVSRLHGEVSRRIFRKLFPRWPAHEVPIGHITNGVHMPTWDSPEADELWTRLCGKNRWCGPEVNLEPGIAKVQPADVWSMRNRARKTLVDYVRQRLARQLAGHGAPSAEIRNATRIFDPHFLTIGFARRFATYKRPNLLLSDPARLLSILTSEHRPVQLILAGKAHPDDRAGQALIEEWIHFVRLTAARSRAVFLSDYDVHMTEHLVQGVDLWLNTPRRPWEACGTSGMKVLVNGGLNLSELDGWWAEAYTPEVGWAIGDGAEHGDSPAWDALEAKQLYDLLENDVIPAFYERDAEGIPTRWVKLMKASMTRLTPNFAANRSVRQYTEQHYVPAAGAYGKRAAQSGAEGAAIARWRHELEVNWGRIRFGSFSVTPGQDQHRFEVEVWLGELSPADVQVELYADPVPGFPAARLPMTPAPEGPPASAHLYSAAAPAARPPSHYTPRIIPRREGVSVPLECPLILWYR